MILILVSGDVREADVVLLLAGKNRDDRALNFNG
jgi:hypothetical protein